MSKVTILSGIFAGIPAELVGPGASSSKVKVVIFGRETIVELPNDSFTASDEPFDPYETFAKQILADRRWEAREASNNWWLERERDLSASTWQEHLKMQDAIEVRVAQETARLIERLREGVADTNEYSIIDAYFREQQALFCPFRWKRSQEEVSDADSLLHGERIQKITALQRVAYRAWWSVQPRSTESCADFLAEVWSGDDFEAMGRVEFEAFNQWGREAVELILNRYRDVPLRVTELDALPEDHPWRVWSELDPGKAVRRGFEGIAEQASTLVDALAHHVRAIYVIELKDDYSLVYACDAEEGYGEQRKPRLSLLFGGPSLKDQELEMIDAQLSDYVKSCGWSVPEELRAIYKIHHGLGHLSAFVDDFDNAGSIVPASSLFVLGEIMNEIAEEQDFEPQGYRFDDLLAFFNDGAGNSENFFRQLPNEQPVGTVDWDHETREVSSVRPFWEFVQGSPLEWWFGIANY